MCGIFIALAKDTTIDPAACRRALATMHWRGPDCMFSQVWEGRLFLGQTVLSITGDAHAGGQHQRAPSGRYDVLFNGEIYNFRELQARVLEETPGPSPRSGTDTEVLAGLHDARSPAEVVALLDGMYAYAVFDRAARRLHLVRDPQGEKSLYVYEDARWLVVASEIRAIRTFLPEITLNAQALRDYFRSRHLVLPGRSVFQGIRQLDPGTIETVELDSLDHATVQAARLRDWISPRRLEANARRPIESLVDELDSLLARCVREMIPPTRRFAAVVSGGVDSSLIAHYLVAHGHPELLVAVNHVGKDRISADLGGFERALGRTIAVVPVDPAAYAAEIWRCQQSCGGPLHSHSFVGQAVQSSLVRASGCRVLFGGDGADELFGGYDAYLGVQDALGRFSPSPYSGHQEPLVAFQEDAPEPYQAQLAGVWAQALDAYGCVAAPRDRGRLAAMFADAVCQLPEVGLRGADLMSMMWSVETRSVYLRRPVIEFALNLPAAARIDGAAEPLLQTKTVLKRLFLRHFPVGLLVEKQGFAGFPNESALGLGDPHDYMALKTLGVRGESLRKAWADRATAWKLINTEYFLRYSGLVNATVPGMVPA